MLLHFVLIQKCNASDRQGSDRNVAKTGDLKVYACKYAQMEWKISALRFRKKKTLVNIPKES
jgi:hypothetical protein